LDAQCFGTDHVRRKKEKQEKMVEPGQLQRSAGDIIGRGECVGETKGRPFGGRNVRKVELH